MGRTYFFSQTLWKPVPVGRKGAMASFRSRQKRLSEVQNPEPVLEGLRR